MAATTELILVRHGEAHCNVAGIAGGPDGCTGLTERGRAQVRKLGKRLQGEQVDVVYAGPRLRVRQTGDILARSLGIRLLVEPDLAGPDHGTADGRSWRQIEDEFGGPPMSRPDRPYAPGAESWNAYAGRTAAVLASLVARHPGRRILVAGHGETIATAHEFLLGLPAGSSAQVRFAAENSALTRWVLQETRFGARIWTLGVHNDTTHLIGA